MTVTINGTTGIDKVQDGSIQAADLASGVPSRSQLPAGTVLQVVNVTNANTQLTTSMSYVDTAVAASITPTSSTSKVLVIVHLQAASNTSGVIGGFGAQIKRNSTAIVGIQNSAFYSLGASRATISTCYLDSPATTSSTTYTVQIKAAGGGNVLLSPDGAADVNTITLMEIAA